MTSRSLLRAAVSYSGVVPIKWWLLRPGLYCFTYHRVGDARDTEFDRNTFSCTAARFEEHVRFLRDKFDILTLDQVRHAIGRGGVTRPAALITFDDGYIDNYAIAFPILRKYGVPAAFFLPTAFIDSAAIPWWDEMAWLLRPMAGREVRLAGADQPFAIDAAHPDRSIVRVMKFVKTRNLPMEEQVEEVRAVCGGRRPAPPGAGARLFMTWEDAREMRAAGMDIGSHTHTHRLLARLDAAAQQEELGRSKEILEGRLGSPVESIAYPVGSRAAYTAETCRLAEAVGYRLGFNFLRQTNRFPLRDPLDIGRLAVDGNVSPAGVRSLTCFPAVYAG